MNYVSTLNNGKNLTSRQKKSDNRIKKEYEEKVQAAGHVLPSLYAAILAPYGLPDRPYIRQSVVVLVDICNFEVHIFQPHHKNYSCLVNNIQEIFMAKNVKKTAN